MRKAGLWVSMTLDKFTKLCLSLYMCFVNYLRNPVRHFEIFIAVLLRLACPVKVQKMLQVIPGVKLK